MKLEISERKNTTAKAKEVTKKLIETLNKTGFSSDINTVESSEFFAKCERDNDCMPSDFHYREWENTQAKFKIQNGVLKIVSVEFDDLCENTTYLNDIGYYDQIHFSDMVICLEEVIQKHNELCEMKDNQIEEFLSFCDAYAKK